MGGKIKVLRKVIIDKEILSSYFPHAHPAIGMHCFLTVLNSVKIFLYVGSSYLPFSTCVWEGMSQNITFFFFSYPVMQSEIRFSKIGCSPSGGL